MKERKKSYRTSSSIDLDAIYLPEKAPSRSQSSARPGEFPSTRGIHSTMYRGKLWTMRQYSGYATAQETNRRFRRLLELGQTGLSVAFDLPTQMGYDPDHPLAEGEVGRVGVSIATVEDLKALFHGIPLSEVSVSMTINATASTLLAMLLVAAEEGGVAWEKLTGTVQNDILKEYISRGTYIYPPEPSLRLAVDLFAFCLERVRRWNVISISGYHMREAGATASQELAFTMANGLCYAAKSVERGLPIDELGKRLSFFFCAHNHFLEEVAKFRAARRMWAALLRDRFGARDPRALALRFHTQTAGCTLTAQEPHNNVTRVALQALSAILGGTQSLHTNALDEALGLPTERAAMLALRTQQVLAYETGVADTADPLGGSYAIEALTDELEHRAKEYIAEVDRMGGAVQAVESGYYRREIEKSAYEEQKRVEAGEQLIVGVNLHRTEKAKPIPVLRPSARARKEQIRRLQTVRKKRDNQKVQRLLDGLRDAARGRDNLMRPILEAVRARATIGEIADALRAIFGVYQPKTL